MNLPRKSSVFGYNFKDETLFDLAVTHKSVSSKNNERLEFLGDAVLGFIISSEIVKRFPKATEGELTRIRAYLVNG
ncbi:MAG: ribonuclease III domain-containing protein, partial [Pseudomonadota bacterium]|nr:ribonuclease III domain-containing protein [Pseudomonadota bacterium]